MTQSQRRRTGAAMKELCVGSGGPSRIGTAPEPTPAGRRLRAKPGKENHHDRRLAVAACWSHVPIAISSRCDLLGSLRNGRKGEKSSPASDRSDRGVEIGKSSGAGVLR